MNRTQCPDCNSGLQPGKTSCRCGWSEPTVTAGKPEVVRVICDTPSCGEPAFVRDGDKNVCLRCYEGAHHNAAFERCKAMGLTTVEDMRAHCAKLGKTLFRRGPDFEGWAERMGQGTVDIVVRMGGKDDLKLLERLRERAVIDERNKIVPLEQRPALRAEREAKVKAERERIEKILKEHGVVRQPQVDTEAAA